MSHLAIGLFQPVYCFDPLPITRHIVLKLTVPDLTGSVPSSVNRMDVNPSYPCSGYLRYSQVQICSLLRSRNVTIVATLVGVPWNARPQLRWEIRTTECRSSHLFSELDHVVSHMDPRLLEAGCRGIALHVNRTPNQSQSLRQYVKTDTEKSVSWSAC